MSYQLYDEGAAIRFSSDGDGGMLICKQSIRKIMVVREDIIKIEVQNRSAIYLRRMQITLPVSVSAAALAETLNVWIENCLCHYGEDTGIR